MGFEEESEMAHEKIKAEIFAWLEENFMNTICDIHQEQWGVPCGPTLAMLRGEHEISHYIRYGFKSCEEQ